MKLALARGRRSGAFLLGAVVEPDLVLERRKRSLGVAIFALTGHCRAGRSENPMMGTGGRISTNAAPLRLDMRLLFRRQRPHLRNRSTAGPTGRTGGAFRVALGGDGGESNSPSKRRQARMYYRLIR